MIALVNLSAVPPERRAAAWRSFLESERQTLSERHRSASGIDAARQWSTSIDHVVSGLFRAARQVDLGPLALVAVGGYGRMELAPYSDLDLWFVLDEGAGSPRADDPRLGRLAEEILYPLWDLKLEVGHAFRSVGDLGSLAKEDLTAATALLDARLVDGEEAFFRRLAEMRARLGAEDPIAFAERLAAEKRARHEKFGDTVYLLEPDLKNGKGGYRDLLIALWAAKARFRVNDLPGLLALGQATTRQVRALERAREFFLRVRAAAHLYAGRKQDRLLFEVQEAIAPGLCRAADEPAGDIRPAVPLPVERLMQEYYLHAKAVQQEGGRLLERALERPPRRPSTRRIDDSFVLWNGKLSTHGPEIFRDRPAEMLRIFRVAHETGAPIYGHTLDLIAETCARSETAARLGSDPDASRHFQALLTDLADGAVLEQMHGLGLLTALLPEFGPCTGRVQHDLYHVFTVDQHSLYAVAHLKAIGRGELGDKLPVATQAFGEVRDRLPLFLATLLHDVGKPFGKAHSESGACLARAVATRLGLDEAAIAQAERLVREHLLLAHLSQRRDLDDVEMVAHLAAQLGSEETLRQLYLLTLADMAMVAPGNLTSWKERLLRELYVRTLGHFRRGPDLAGQDRSARKARHQRRAAELLGERPDSPSLTAWFAGLPDRYFAQAPPRTIARHVALSRRRTQAVAAEFVHRPSKGWSELTVIADDAPGLLAKIAGVLWASRMDVLAAQIASRRRDDQPAEAIDVFWVRDRHGRALNRSEERTAHLPSLVADLERVVSGAQSVEELIAARQQTSGTLPGRVLPAVPTEVSIDNEVSADFTVVDVLTQDRPGVLYTITRTLSSLGLDIQLSKVATEAARVADVFYVRSADGRRLEAHEGDRLRDALIAALAALPASPTRR